MFNKLSKTLLSTAVFAVASFSVCASQLTEAEAQSALLQVDAFRSESASVKVSATVKAFDEDVLKHTKQYDVYSSSSKRSLVVFKSDSEKGQKVLMKGSDYWMFMPKSRRPIRITPMQKLLGEASLGDIATLSWSEDYQVKSVAHAEGVIQLELQANSPKLSYQNIQLEIDQNDYFPKKAALYLRSGKHAKTAFFERGIRDNKVKVVAMTLQDKMQKGQKTVIAYDAVQQIEVPDKLFNPQILIRSDLDQLLTE
ncbi:outer membrane lipoprotein-sorting protein [Pseudoalteromonas piscicida]|uniref:Outer membrane lipoprotein-sorting protein n=1 Tax=Pseudoalteromonas piscicida TaxID=43662 RepID=A0AAD0W5R1_PSEO7|nr:outer membrane lipoprotein-sorting protein [Pseudoalteromonas piscicida]ASD68787.1 outer membrane lipoprotein-sorting protein [Pseudoalteromonas piscicida]AXQ99530.1 outer membrane lipoprotein-sorting protein [Pseudoalteromonas piscicida]AXR03846.1 outer membrane lipoprotein-sorting protein [Pseudoalteromonas piscicida]